jgi:hypothetical protein
MTDRTAFTISLPTELHIFAQAEAARRCVSAEDYIATLIERERSYYADNAARERMQTERTLRDNAQQDALHALRTLRDDFESRDEGTAMAVRVMQCATGRTDLKNMKFSDVKPEYYPRVTELCKIVLANGGEWPEVPSALCRQESLVGPGESPE